MSAPQAAHLLEIEPLHALPPPRLVQHAIGREHAILDLSFDRNGDDFYACLEPSSDAHPPIFIDANDRRVAWALFGEDARFDLGIALYRPMSVEVIRRKVEQN